MTRSPPVVAYFSRQAPRYRSGFGDGVSQRVRASETRAVLQGLGPVRGLRVLELGAGDGHYTRALVEAGAALVVAVDLVEEMVARLPQEGVRGVVADATTVDVGERFPAILSAGMLEFVDDPAAVLRNAWRHALPGARLVVLAPTLDLPGRLYQRWHRSHGVTVHLFEAAALAALGTTAGWKLEGIVRAGLFAHVATWVREDA